MFKKYNKAISVALTATLILGVFSGCGSEVGDTNNSQSVQNTNDIERTTITYWDIFCESMYPDSYPESLIEAKFPVDIVVDRTNHINMSQVVELLTPENMPDVIWTDQSVDYIQDLGLTRTIPYEMVEQYAPSFLGIYNNYPTIYTSIMDFDETDEFFALNGATEQSAAIACSLYADYYRYDWIEELGIELDFEVTQISDNFYVAHTGPTLEKFEEIMHGFTFGDPDGNGIDDTYGATFDGMTRFDLLYSGFGITAGVNNVNDHAEQFYTTDGFKDFSIWFSDLYSKGYIVEDFMKQDTTASREKIQTEQAGYFLESSIAINSWAFERPPLSLIEENPDVKFLVTPGLSDENGNGTIIKNAMPTFGQICLINKDVSDEKLALILQILEYVNFGDDKLSFWFGEEGIDWKMDEDGEVEILNKLGHAENGSRIFVQNVMVDELFHAVSVEKVFAQGSDFWLYDCIWRENDREHYQYKLDLYKETNYNDLALKYSGGCNAIYLKYFENWVYNDLNVTDSWDKYIDELNQAGYSEMMEELDKVIPLDEMILNFIN